MPTRRVFCLFFCSRVEHSNVHGNNIHTMTTRPRYIIDCCTAKKASRHLLEDIDASTTIHDAKHNIPPFSGGVGDNWHQFEWICIDRGTLNDDDTFLDSGLSMDKPLLHVFRFLGPNIRCKFNMCDFTDHERVELNQRLGKELKATVEGNDVAKSIGAKIHAGNVGDVSSIGAKRVVVSIQVRGTPWFFMVLFNKTHPYAPPKVQLLCPRLHAHHSLVNIEDGTISLPLGGGATLWSPATTLFVLLCSIHGRINRAGERDKSGLGAGGAEQRDPPCLEVVDQHIPSLLADEALQALVHDPWSTFEQYQ